MGNIVESFKKLLGLDSGGDDIFKRPVWKKLNILVLIAAAGILLIILANTFTTTGKSQDGTTNTPPPESPKEPTVLSNAPLDMNKLEATLAQKLEQVLVEINGVGEVKVNVNLASTTQKDYATNMNTNNKTTREQDQKGGNRTITETNEIGQMVLVRENQGNKEEPVVVKETKPEVKGVIVVAEGAKDPAIKADLMKAVQVYLDVPLYKVIVLPKESR